MLTKEQKNVLYDLYISDVWSGDPKMATYCANKVATLAELPNGDMIPVDKQKIENDFCFGESGYDYDDAQRAAAHARTSEDHFRRENMKQFNGLLDAIREQYELHDAERPNLPNQVLCIAEKPFHTQPENSKLKDVRFFYAWEFLDAFCGSAHIRDLPGASFTRYEQKYRIPTLEELDAIKAAHEQAAEEHANKIEKYLKRYGTSKVHAWTYWRDA